MWPYCITKLADHLEKYVVQFYDVIYVIFLYILNCISDRGFANQNPKTGRKRICTIICYYEILEQAFYGLRWVSEIVAPLIISDYKISYISYITDVDFHHITAIFNECGEWDHIQIKLKKKKILCKLVQKHKTTYLRLYWKNIII